MDENKARTSPGHQQCDGLSERFNRSLKKMISCYISDNHKDWDEKLPMLMFAYNTASNSTTRLSPFKMLYGRKPKIPVDLIFQITI